MTFLNICIISQEFPPYTNWGGIAVYNGEIAGMFRELGHEVTVVSRAEKGAPAFEVLGSGVRVWRVDMPLHRKYFLGRTLDRLLHARIVARKVKELDAQKPFDVIETTESGLEGDHLLLDKSFRSRMVIQCHGSNAFGVVPAGPLACIHRLDWKWSFMRELRSLTLAENVVVATEAARQLLIDKGVIAKKINLIHHGIDIGRFSRGDEPSPARLEVGFAGRLEKRKGIDYIWQVMDLIGPDAGIRFHFKGAIHPSMSEDVKAAMDRFRSFSVYHGAGESFDMPAYYQSLHVLLQPSRFESFGLAYVEAMACGLVVFGGVGGGGSEIIQSGRTGFLVDPDGDPRPVATKLREIAANLPAFTEMRRQAREEVVRRFSLEACARLKIAYYEERIVGPLRLLRSPARRQS